MPLQNYFIILLCAYLASFVVLGLFLGVGYDAVEWMVDPSFNLHSAERFLYLFLDYLVFTGIVIWSASTVFGYFSLSEIIIATEFQIIIPAVLFIVVRSLTRCYSSRVARQLLLSFVLVLLVASAITLTAFFITETDFSKIFERLQFSKKDIAAILTSAALVPYLTDLLLFKGLNRFRFLKENVIKNKRMIDIVSKLPVNIETIIGDKDINKQIGRLIRNSNKCLYIFSNRYKTIYDNLGEILKFAEKPDVTLKLFGSAFDGKNSEAQQRFKVIKERGLNICIRQYEGIRIIMRDENEVMVSYGTGNYEGSHVGLYSNHKTAVAFFLSYFNAVCSECGFRCDKRCKINENKEFQARRL